MRAYYSLGLLASLFFVTGEAKPCGAAFGTSYTIKPAQKIVVGYRNGIETYVFNPEFCGKADSFGLILPIPSTPTANPKLASQQLLADLATVAAPTVVTTTRCGGKGTGGAASWGQGGASNGGGGTTVIDRGQVGIFDWALLQATSVSAFTTWLTNNGFPYPANATSAFQSYVTNGWYFIAFKVSTSGVSGTAGAAATASAGAAGNSSTICGSFGPVSLSFPVTPNPVIPARIAALSSSSLLNWDVFVVGANQMRVQEYAATLMFSGSISDSDLTAHPSLVSVAQAGDRLTELSLSFLPITDLILETNPNPADFRRVEQQTLYLASACSTGGAATGGNSAVGGAGGNSGAPTGGTASGGMPVGGTASGGIPVGGVSSGGAATGGLPGSGGLPGTGGTVATGGAATGGRPGSGGLPSTGGTVATGGTTLARDGGASSVDTSQVEVGAADPNQPTGCSCAINSLGSDTTQRSLGILGLFGAAAALGRRRRAKRRQ